MSNSSPDVRHDGTRIPQQTRAKRTYESIALAGQEILQDIGLEGFNTNSISERAGVTAPVFYRYFKDKYALLELLGRRLTDLQNDIVIDTSNSTDLPGNVEALRAEIYHVLKSTYAVTSEFTGASAILTTLRATPALASIRLDSNHDMSTLSAARLRAIRPELSRKAAYERCRLGTEIGYSAVEMLLEQPKLSRKHILNLTADALMTLYT